MLSRAAPQGLPGLRRLVHTGLGRAFGPPPFARSAEPGDPGLFGPGSATWRIIAEPAAIVGGVRALFVQLLHPLAMAGVADHSEFRADPLGRLQRTSAYVTTTAYGSTRQAFEVARRVRRVHTGVVGVAPDGRPYEGGDPHLLTWVSIALTSSFLATDRVFAPDPADPDCADAFVAEQSRAAALLDPRVDLDRIAADPSAVVALRAGTLDLPMLADGILPLTVADLDAAITAYRPELGVIAQGRDALRFLLWPSIPPALRAGYLPLAGGALSTIDPVDRRLLGPLAQAMAVGPLPLQARLLVTALRVGGGTSPAQAAAARRAGQDA